MREAERTDRCCFCLPIKLGLMFIISFQFVQAIWYIINGINYMQYTYWPAWGGALAFSGLIALVPNYFNWKWIKNDVLETRNIMNVGLLA